MPGRFDVRTLAAGDVFQRTLAVDRLAERVDDAAKKALADRGSHDLAGALHGRAFLDAAVITEDHDADVVGLEVEGHALEAAFELDELAGLNAVEAINAGDTVADREDLADIRHFSINTEVIDLRLQDARNFCG